MKILVKIDLSCEFYTFYMSMHTLLFGNEIKSF